MSCALPPSLLVCILLCFLCKLPCFHFCWREHKGWSTEKLFVPTAPKPAHRDVQSSTSLKFADKPLTCSPDTSNQPCSTPAVFTSILWHRPTSWGNGTRMPFIVQHFSSTYLKESCVRFKKLAYLLSEVCHEVTIEPGLQFQIQRSNHCMEWIGGNTIEKISCWQHFSPKCSTPMALFIHSSPRLLF